jgi:hypothetical protein
MMTVMINNVPHKLQFTHYYRDVERLTRKNEFVTVTIPTICCARIWPADEPEMYVEGSAFLNPEDNPDKAVGRRIALERAASLFEEKSERAAIWKAVRDAGIKLR